MKNARIFRTTADVISAIDNDIEGLNERFSNMAARDLKAIELKHVGFVEALPEHEEYAFYLSGFAPFAVRFTERRIPASAIRARVHRMMDQIEAATGERPSRRQARPLKEQAIDEMAPGVPETHTVVRGYFDTSRHLIVLDCSSISRAESIIDHLRLAMGSLSCVPLHGDNAPRTVLTEWVRGTLAPGKIEIGDSAKLKASGEPAAVTIRETDLAFDGVQDLVRCGMRCASLALSLPMTAHFTLRDDVSLSGIKFDGELFMGDETDGDDAAAVAAGTFIVEADALATILGELDEPLGLRLGKPVPREGDDE